MARKETESLQGVAKSEATQSFNFSFQVGASILLFQEIQLFANYRKGEVRVGQWDDQGIRERIPLEQKENGSSFLVFLITLPPLYMI